MAKDAPTPEQIRQIKTLWAEEINQAIESGNLEKVKLDLDGPLLGGICNISSEQRRRNLLRRFCNHIDEESAPDQAGDS